MEREELIKKIDSIKDKIEKIDKEREELMKELHETLPIKVGDKVKIMLNNENEKRDKDSDKFLRFAFVNKIEVNLRGKDRKAGIEFDLQKCKADGTISQHADHLRYGEYVTMNK